MFNYIWSIAGAAHQNCTLFMTYMPGDKFIAFDVPFHLALKGDEFLKQDHTDPPGIDVHYCIKYTPGGEDGIKIHSSGLVWCQHMTHQSHPFHLGALANICKGKLADFASKIALLNQQHATHTPSSSSAGSMQSLQPSSSSSTSAGIMSVP